MDAIETRLTSLERENRKLKWGVCTLLLLTVVVAWRRPANAAGRFEKLVVRELSAVDDEGQEFCSIRIGRTGPGVDQYPLVEVRGKNGSARLLGLDGGGMVEVEGGKCHALLSVLDEGVANVILRNDQAEISLANNGDDENGRYPRLIVSDGAGRWRAALGIGVEEGADSAASVSLTNQNGRSIALRDDGRLYPGGRHSP